jgi:hypothetical protein
MFQSPVILKERPLRPSFRGCEKQRYGPTIEKGDPFVKGYLTARPAPQSLPVQAAISRIPSTILGPSRNTASLV